MLMSFSVNAPLGTDASEAQACNSLEFVLYITWLGSWDLVISYSLCNFQIWYNNVPHPKLVEYKKDQNWVRKSGDYFVFPGGGTQFKAGVTRYIRFIEQVILSCARYVLLNSLISIGAR
jgi:hypothetical protein